MLPCWAKAMPIPAVMTRNVPQKKESPIPDNGPISPTFRLLMDSFIKIVCFGAFLFHCNRKVNDKGRHGA